jgi:hypothetical protein
VKFIKTDFRLNEVGIRDSEIARICFFERDDDEPFLCNFGDLSAETVFKSKSSVKSWLACFDFTVTSKNQNHLVLVAVVMAITNIDIDSFVGRYVVIMRLDNSL